MKNDNFLVEMRDVEKIYKHGLVEKTVLQSVNLQIAPHEFIALMGPSGSGKSTLLNIIGMTLRASTGSHEFLGQRTDEIADTTLTEWRRRHIGYVFQNFNLINDLTAYENVEVALLYQVMRASDRKQRIADVMEQVGISDLGGQYPHELSGGQQQRVAIARAIASKPMLLLADEPTGNLDSRCGMEIMQLFKDLNATGTTILVATHSTAHAHFTHRIINMLDGRIFADSLNPPMHQVKYAI